MAVSIATHPVFSPGTPAALFEKRTLPTGNFDVASEGKRFIVRDRTERPLLIHVVNNWFEEFRGR
jgi:hypothetical protein